MSEFFFRDTIPEFWKLIYAEYKRLYASHGTEPFHFTAPDPKTQPLEQYLPKDGDTIMFAFIGASGREAISVDVEFQPDRELVQVMSYYQSAQEHAANSLWKNVLSSLEKDSRWLDPAAVVRNNSKTIRGPQPRTIETLKRLREIRLQAINNGWPIPKKPIARQDAGTISEMTWKRYDPDLWKRWNDKNYK